MKQWENGGHSSIVPTFRPSLKIWAQLACHRPVAPSQCLDLRGMMLFFPYIHYLVGGFDHLEKYEFVSWGYYSQYMEK